MAGPDGLLHDPERGLAPPNAAKGDNSHAVPPSPAHAASEKTRESTDIQAAASAPPSSKGNSTTCGDANASSNKTSSHPLLEKWKGRFPPTVQKTSNTVWTYMNGPDPPRIWKIRPILPRLQQFPLRLVDRICPRRWQRILALFIFCVCWIATFGAVLHKSSVADVVDGYGQPILIQCGSTFW